MRAWYSQPGAGPKAQARIARILDAIEDLRERPTRSAKGKAPGTRTRLVEEHRIVYRVSNDTGDDDTAGDVQIVRIWRPGQNRPARL